MAEDLCFLTALELRDRIRSRDVTPSDVAEAVLERIARIDGDMNAFVVHDPDQVRADARALTDAMADGGELGPLHGVPYSIKELTSIAGLPLTFGLMPLKDNVGTRDAAVYRRMRDAGGLFLGKTNSPESGYYGGTDNHIFGATHNAWRQGLTPGGSSGGAAAAVAAGLGPLAEGSDGAGSVRIPASLNGVVGLKPSIGRIPQTVLAGRHHTWAFHGPITRTVADAGLMMDVVAGPDPEDPLTLPDASGGFLAATERDVSGLRIAWSPDLGFAQVDPEVVEICARAVRAFEELGCTIVEADPGWDDPEQAMWEGVWLPGFASEWEMVDDWEAWRGQVDDDLIDLLHEGAQLPTVRASVAGDARGAHYDRFAAFMADHDLLASPTLASPAFGADEFCPPHLQDEPLRRRLLGWLLTYPYNMTGTPAITVPAGFTGDGRPVGLQLAGGLHADREVLQAAASFERARPWADKWPER
ncbi:amidase [Capillimicrobium parvum]|uniref:Acylamidase n=1 Tax=Capillimicrobium parvum TaxID=2884022 RepID=A0A9E6Y0W1_9ACTN|nr:amidase family protein [Capillimicrobium parvum]UGS37371.1 Acylamidase [Capillimicrobium parvum]